MNTKDYKALYGKEMSMNYKLLVDTAILAGEIMLRGGAEIYRVEDTIKRILRLSGFKDCEVSVISSSIMVMLAGPGIDEITKIRSIDDRSIDLGNIYYVNTISRNLCSDKITLEEAHDQLICLGKAKRYPEWLKNICMIISAVSFAVLLGATPIECVLAAINGIFITLSRLIYHSVNINRFVSNMIICVAIAISTSLLTALPGINATIEPVIAGSIMTMLPGVALTNAFRDTLQGDYLSGGARIVEAFVTAASLAVGIYAGLAIGKMILGGLI